MVQRPLVSAEDLAGPDGPGWFNEMFAATGRGDGAQIIGVNAQRVGTGQVGDSVRFELHWDTPGAGPASVVGKFPSDDPQTRATARMVQTYEREYGFYAEVQERVALATPRIHHVYIDAPTGDFTLIMEDLRSATQGDQLAGCSLDDALAIADAAAGLHAPTWPLADTCGDIDWLVPPDPAQIADRAGLYRALADGFIERYGDRLGPDVIETVRWLGPRIETVQATIAGLGRVGHCVTHNDFRLDNMLFADGADAAHLTTVDWQTVAGGYGPVDLAYGIGSALLPDARRTHEATIFEHYLHRWAEQAPAGQGLDLSDPTVRAEMWDAYRLGSTTGLGMAVVASMIVGRTDRGDEMFCVMAERHADQMDALGVVDLID